MFPACTAGLHGSAAAGTAAIDSTPPPPAAPAAYPQGVGYGISVAAFFVYQRIKMRQLAAESAKPGVAAGGKASPAEAGKAGADLPRYQAVPVIEARAGSVPVSPAHKA